ncbi:MAG: hypothetical protein VX680_02275 [Candidatus Neomarinimicrobiota bacterium]|nr:hypothetical protein [Candidatus Neomarinimicrobiota bacterium]|tara:strand:+ start:721 stop:996 length:276 start_codon:yes stop_codon:yes gene_type:complete
MMGIYKKILRGIVSILFLTLLACQDNSECSDCGGNLLDGFLFKKVTQEDLADIGSIDGVNIGICIRYQLSGLTEGDFDLETIEIVDDCCCD